MIKILHSADWHLDSPFPGRSPEDTRQLREDLLGIPDTIAQLVRREGCDLVLLAGDVFDGPYTQAGLDAVRTALAQMQVPVFISPGNHDFCSPHSPWLRESWPENVHIFTKSTIESIPVPHLNCRVYGAGFQSMDCPGLLEGFQADCTEKYALGVLHGAPMKRNSPYNPITSHQVQNSALDYLALGHIHQSGSFRAGSTLCAWPGCPMGRGFDELGQKGVLLVTISDTAEANFLPLDFPQFHDLTVDVGDDPAAALNRLLPPVGNSDHYRITFTGESEKLQIAALTAAFAHFPHLQLLDKTQLPIDLWAGAGEDSLEGIYFDLLRQHGKQGELAARISRLILSGQEVDLL